MKKKILFLVNHDIVIYNFRREIVEKFLDEGYEVIISSPYGERIDELVELGAIFEEVEIDRHGKNVFSELKLILYYKKLLKKIKPDYIFGFTIKPNIYGALVAKQMGIPFVANITGLGSAVENKGILQLISVLLYKVSFSKIQTVFFQNKENMDFFIEKNIAVGKHKQLPGSGVNLKHFEPLSYPNEETIDFVFISRIMKEKGIDQYLEAAAYIKKKYPTTKFHICGFCEESYEEILREYQKNKIIIYHGMVKDVREILKKTHCTVHPTYYPEGLSNVLLESAACSRPIITTNRSGTREVVEENINGFFVKTKDTSSLIEKLEKFILLNHDAKKDMGVNGRIKVETQFDRSIVVNAYLSELEK